MHRVTFDIIGANAQALSTAKTRGGPALDVLQLDDGYMTNWGDWHVSK
jgi:hypothetical protein